MIAWKLLFDGEKIKLLIAKDLNLLRGIFLMGKISTFLGVGQDFPPSPGFPIKVQGKEGQSTPGGCNNFLTFLWRREIPWHTILGDNPDGHWFGLSNLVLIKLFQIIHNCVTECILQAKIFVKTSLKANKDIYLFPNMWDFQYVKIVSNRRGKFKLLGLQGTPHPPKQKIYSM